MAGDTVDDYYINSCLRNVNSYLFLSKRGYVIGAEMDLQAGANFFLKEQSNLLIFYQSS
ncbi:hypothetical protein RZN22_07545 [Bacillaceae bacterium S4-13-58]